MSEIDLSFLKNWENLSQIEINSINILKEGLNLIFKNINKKDIICIYLKGSFLRREMNENSDVDVSIILTEDKYLEILNDLQLKFGNRLNFEFSGYSIQELKFGKLSKLGKKSRVGPARFTRLIHSYKLIYGEELNIKNLYFKKDFLILKNVIKLFKNLFLPNYKKGDLKIYDLLKQTMWLFELEVSYKNPDFKFTNWKSLLNYYKKGDFIFQVLELKNSNEINKEEEKDFIINLKRYLINLKK